MNTTEASYGSGRPSPEVKETEYKDPAKVGKVLFVVLVIGLVVDLFGLRASLGQLSVLQDIAAGSFVSDAAATQSDDLMMRSELLQATLGLITGLVWIVWFRRLYRNVMPLGARGLRFSPGWAVGAWFVPLLNLVRPKAIMDDIWRASDPEMPEDLGTQWHDRRVPFFLTVWWLLFIASAVFSRISASLLDATQLEDLITSARVAVFEDLAWIPAGVMALLVVRAATERQCERARRVRSTAAGG